MKNETSPNTLKEVTDRKKELFGSQALVPAATARQELVVHKDPQLVIAALPEMVKQGNFDQLKSYGQDVVDHLAVTAQKATERMIQLDKQAAESGVGKTSSELAALSDELDYSKVQGKLEPLIKSLGLTKIPLIGSLIGRMGVMSEQEKITKVVENIQAMIDKREPMLESLHGTKDNLHVSAYAVMDMMKDLEAGRSVLCDRLEGSVLIRDHVKQLYDAETDPLEKKKLERAVAIASRNHEGLSGLNMVVSKTQLQSHNSLGLNDQLSQSIDDAIKIIPTVMNIGASALMTTVATSRATAELSELSTATKKVLGAADVATAHNLAQAEKLRETGLIPVEEMKQGITKLVEAAKRIRELQEKSIESSQSRTKAIEELTAVVDQELIDSGAVTSGTKAKREKREKKVQDNAIDI